MTARLAAARVLLAATTILAYLLFALPVGVSAASTFTVNAADDTNDGICNAAHCSLREAINAANANPGADTIVFTIVGVPSIKPTSALPTVTSPVVIDGTTQPGFVGKPIVELDGTLAGPSADGLRISAGNSTLRGLVVNSFTASGIHILTSGGNTIVGSHIGTDVAGALARGNGKGNTSFDSSTPGGVFVEGTSANTIGGTAAADRNLISGNNGNGVLLRGVGATSNAIRGNYVGVDVTGTTAMVNIILGISIVHAAQNTVGGTVTGARNVVSGGVSIEGSAAAGNVVAGNYIGIDATGSLATNVQGSGVTIRGAANNTVGGTVAGARNVISGHFFRGLVISGSGASGNRVQGNFIGTDATGTKPIPNADSSIGLGGGILISGAPNNLVGGTSAGARNLISGNGSSGMAIADACSCCPLLCDFATGNLVQGNFIGTDVTGTKPLPNFPFDAGNGSGVVLAGSMNTVGGTSPGARNLISGNAGAGVFVRGQSNVVQGNFIGTDVTGKLALGNATPSLSEDTGGVVVSGFFSLPSSGTQNLIGGTTAAARNVISGNNGAGIVLSDFSGAADRNILQGNYIGVDVTGTASLGNLQAGVNVAGATNTTIGGTTPSAANVIRNNGGDGVIVSGFGTSGQGNAILGNSITANGQLGIDLTPCCTGGDGVTPNDPGDADEGGNALQNYPVLTSATSRGGMGMGMGMGMGRVVVISGTLNSRASTTYRVELYSNVACDVSGHGEGQTFLGALNVATDAAGNAAFTVTLAASVPAGRAATATATDPSGNTSEFSACRTVERRGGQG